MNLLNAVIASFVLVAAPALADIRETPALGEEATAPAGGTIWEQYQFEGQPGVIIKAPVQARWGSTESVDLPAGTALMLLPKKKVRACQSVRELNNLPVKVLLWSSCLTDTDNDGRFDQVSYTDGGFSKPLDPPVPYERATIEVAGDDARTFSRRLLFLGSDATSLKLSYREFASGTARPAFTEELTLPLGKTFPQDVAVKDRIITLLGIDGMGLKYKLTK